MRIGTRDKTSRNTRAPMRRPGGFWKRRQVREPDLQAELDFARATAQSLQQQLHAALAQREVLRRELESSLAVGMAHRHWWALGGLLRGVLRRRYRFALVPLNDLMPRLEELNTWDVVGLDPQLAMLPVGGVYPSGWVLLRSKISHKVEGYGESRLYLDLGQGYRQEDSLRIPVSLSGTILELVRLPKGVCGMRWDPVDAHGRLRQEPLVMIEVGTIERLYRMIRRGVSMLRGYPRSLLDPVALSWRRVLLNPQAAYQAAGELRCRGNLPLPSTYEGWIARFDTMTEELRAQMRQEIEAMPRKPLISVVMPTYNTPKRLLRAAIESVRRQVYPHWELCIADDASTRPHVKRLLQRYMKADPRIRVAFRSTNGHISASSNTALELARGDYVALLDHDDELAEQALYHVASAINDHPDVRVIYSDEDKIDLDGERSDPHFKPGWNPDLLHSQNYISHLGVYATELVREVGGFRVGYEGSQDHDLLLRCVARCGDHEIVHVPRVLYHWRVLEGSTALDASEKSYAQQAGIRALQDYFDAQDSEARVGPGLAPNTYRVRYPIPEPAPRVSLLIPTRDRLSLVRTCVESILEKTTYPNYEVVILDNQSVEQETLDWLDEISRDERVRVLSYNHLFNFSAINNFGARHATGEILGLINNDIEVISPDWLTEMVSHACRPEIGCVGAKLYYDNDTIQHAGVILGLGGVAGHSHKYFPRDAPGYFARLLLVQNLSAVTAACMLVRKSVYEEVGGLNERDLKIAFNDVDFCLKVHAAGYRNLWTPYAELYHHESLSRGAEDTPEKQARFTLEIQYMREKWGEILMRDPAYNCNLTTYREDFSIA